MIIAENLCKTYRADNGDKTVFEGVSFVIDRGDRVGVLGRNGAGKSTLIKMIGGVVTPTAGRVELRMSTSWPIGFQGGFQGSLSGIDNIRFISRIYDRPFHDLLAFVDDFSELGADLLEPVKTYSSGMRARLAFGLSLAIDFDCYLIDEVIAVGDQRFQDKCQRLLLNAERPHGLVLASHDANTIRAYCAKALVMHAGKAKLFDDIDLALDIYDYLGREQNNALLPA